MRMCIIATDSWLTRKTCGGSEKQISYIAIALSDEGHEVDLYTVDNEITGDINGVHIIPAWDRTKGIRILRFFTHRMPDLRKKIINNEYDLLYLRGNPIFGVSAISAARSAGIISVLGLASDHNVSWKYWKSYNPGRSIGWYLLEAIKYAYYQKGALKKADVIGIQNSFQRTAVTAFGGKAVTIPNIFIPVDMSDSTPVSKSIDIIWIGRFQFIKGIRNLASLVKRLPKLSFTIIGKSTGDRERKVLQEILEYKNVQYYEHLANEKVASKLNASKILLNTSIFEGFPNTFLEAWYSKVPVISLNVDPNNLLSTFGLGYCSNGNMNILCNTISSLLKNEEKRNMIGKIARKYVLENHNQKSIVKIFESIYSSHSTV